MTLLDGATFALDAPERVDAVWGSGSRVLWAAGEPLLVCGPDGVGKTTLGQQLALHRAQIKRDGLLDLPVVAARAKVLYLALDRPRQAARSMRRMVDESDRDALAERLIVWSGALPFDVMAQPKHLAAFAHEQGADTIVLDCLKDLGGRLGDEPVGLAINTAMQACAEAGIEIAALHHHRKAQAENKKPRLLSDVYGSRWITAACGSVVMLWGEAGDPVVELAHLKQPADVVGPLTLLHDNRRGTTVVDGTRDAFAVVAAAGEPVGAREVAAALFRAKDPSRNDTEKARRRLEAEVADGRLAKLPADPGEPSKWALVEGVHVGGSHGFTSEVGGEVHSPPTPPTGVRGVDPGSDGDNAHVHAQPPLPLTERRDEVLEGDERDAFLDEHRWTDDELDELVATQAAVEAERV